MGSILVRYGYRLKHPTLKERTAINYQLSIINYQLIQDGGMD